MKIPCSFPWDFTKLVCFLTSSKVVYATDWKLEFLFSLLITSNKFKSIGNPNFCKSNSNDLFGFSIVYYNINGVEFIFIGLLLLIGSVICVNLYQMNKNVRTQTYQNYLNVFNFFTDFTSFFFLRKQNLIKQGNNKASTKVFKKK